ncbi:hypothetical protein [Haloarchaeobius sp. HRN-SO-5]|uniref:hypothetical protein n=1 Tax=Haloarchaeobius sp. HRN-SO-5 TaxID=3446118 RepID=UPI003EBE9936
MVLPVALGVDSFPLADLFVSMGIVLLMIVAIVLDLHFDILVVRAVTSGGDTEPPESKVNCSACGARNSGSRTRCKTCDEPLPTE